MKNDFTKAVKRLRWNGKALLLYRKMLNGIYHYGGKFGLWYMRKFVLKDLNTVIDEIGDDFVDDTARTFMREFMNQEEA